MNPDPAWRRELHRIRDAHRSAMADAAERLRNPREPARTDVGQGVSDPSSGGDTRSAAGSVLRPAHLDRRHGAPHVEPDPDEQPRSWLV
ncbi:hypothetical protein CH281_10950 [Rhodococcus sp. 06-221-2]|nr:hypothetical protein CH281_10950 [Rhodococcus sp. 06-221-2]